MPMYWNRPMETIDRESLERIQLERLQKTVHRMYTNVAFYRERMQKQGVKPEDIRTLADLRLLPFMDKRDLRDNYPDGTFAAPRSEIVRISPPPARPASPSSPATPRATSRCGPSAWPGASAARA